MARIKASGGHVHLHRVYINVAKDDQSILIACDGLWDMMIDEFKAKKIEKMVKEEVDKHILDRLKNENAI